MIKTMFRFAGACICGLILSLWILQNNPGVQRLISEKIITTLEQDWKVHIDAGKFKLNLFTFSLYSSGGVLTSADDKKFAWRFDECKINVSPIDLIFKRKLSLGIIFNHIIAQTDISAQRIDIVQHIQDMFLADDEDLKIRPQFIKINNFDLECKCGNSAIKSSFLGTFYLEKKRSLRYPEQSWEGCVTLARATALINKVIILDDASGKAFIRNDRHTGLWNFQTDFSLQSSLLNPSNPYVVRGQWDADKRIINIMNKSDKTKLNFNFDQDQIHGTGTLPLSHIVQSVQALKKDEKAFPPFLQSAGLCKVDLHGVFHDGLLDLHGTGNIDAGSIEQLSWQSIDISCKTPKPFVLAGSATLKASSNLIFKTLFAYDYKRYQGLVKTTNNTPIHLVRGPLRAAWLISPGQLKGSVQLHDDTIKGDYSCHIVDTSSDERVSVQGTCLVKDKLLYASGKVINQSTSPEVPGLFGLKASWDESFLIQRFIFQTQGERLIDVRARKNDPTILDGKFKYSLVHAYFDPALQRTIFGSSCIFDFTLHRYGLKNIDGMIKLSSGRFYIPEGRNLITRLSTYFDIDIENKMVALRDSLIGFCKGSLRSPRAVFCFNEYGHLDTVHAPLCMDHLFVNWKRDFYGFVYGNFLLSKMPESMMNLSGNVVLERSLLRDTILSQDALGNVSGPLGLFNLGSQQLGVDVAITTEKPIRVTTDALDTVAHLDMRVEYEHNNEVLQFPRVTGSISLDGGQLKFLRNKLFIEHGKIQFLANQMNDPLVDLIAKNKINKYQIMLQVTGSLQKPTIMLESSPELTEEQVFGLLVGGSEHTTLQSALPAMLMQHLHKVLLGSKKHMPHGASIFEKLTRPLQYVQITPNFTDQSGRGGIKGTLSVDLNDQLHAQVQKNFNLQDDFSFYLQYMLSDDISLRAVKDQRGEVGSEVEVRLKL